MPLLDRHRQARLLLLALGVGGAGSLVAQSLVERSPFLPPDYQLPGQVTPEETGPPPSANHLQLKGVFALNGEVRVNIFNTQTNEGKWVAINETVEGFRVVSYDTERRSVALDVNGTLSNFDLVKPSDAPMAVATASRQATNPAVRPNVRTVQPSGSPTVRRRTIVPPRTTTTTRPTTTRSIPTRPSQRTVVRPGQPQNTAPNAAGNDASPNNSTPYINPRVRNRANPGN